MDRINFSVLTHTLADLPSRRDVLRGLVGAGVGFGTARLPPPVEAKKKRKPGKPKPNAFGCLNVGDFCQSASQCCSGICQGKKGKKRCKAHDATSCAAGQRNMNCGGEDIPCTSSTGNPGICETTTGNAPYCASSGYYGVPCTKDEDCQLYCGPRAACLPCGYYSLGAAACAGPDACADPSSGATSRRLQDLLHDNRQRGVPRDGR